MERKRICLLGLCLALLCLASVSEAVFMPSTLEVTGIFDRVEEPDDENGQAMSLLVLIVNGKEASGLIRMECTFFDEKGNNIDRNDFMRLYIKRTITAEILEDSGEVVSCRVGT